MMQRFLKRKKRLLSRHMMGEGLSNLSMKELKNLEGKLERGISRIRSKKVKSNLWLIHFFLLKNMKFMLDFLWLNLWLLRVKFPFPDPPFFNIWIFYVTEWAAVCWDRVHAEKGNCFSSWISLLISQCIRT